MHVIFVEPRFPAQPARVRRARSHAVGATRHRHRRAAARTRSTTSCSSWLDALRAGRQRHRRGRARCDAVRCIQSARAGRPPRGRPSRRTSCRPRTCARRCGIPGTSRAHRVPVPRQAGDEGGAARGRRPVRAVDRRASPPTRCARSPQQVGFPLIVKPRDARRRLGHRPRRQRRRARATRIARARRRPRRARSPSRSSSRATRASTTRISDRRPASCTTSSRHYYPNVLEAMRTRWISPQFVTTNRIDARRLRRGARRWARKVIERARHRHLGDAHGVVLRAEGPEVLRDRLPAARRARVGPLRRRQRHRPLPRVGDGDRARPPEPAPSRRFAAGIIALRPDRDGRIAGYDGVDEIAQRASATASSTPTSRRRARRRSRSRPATWRTPGCA